MLGTVPQRKFKHAHHFPNGIVQGNQVHFWICIPPEISMPAAANQIYRNQPLKTRRYCLATTGKFHSVEGPEGVWKFLFLINAENFCGCSYYKYLHLLCAVGNDSGRSYSPAYSRFYFPFPTVLQIHLVVRWKCWVEMFCHHYRIPLIFSFRSKIINWELKD